jgi:hypothetical protein
VGVYTGQTWVGEYSSEVEGVKESLESQLAILLFPAPANIIYVRGSFVAISLLPNLT